MTTPPTSPRPSQAVLAGRDPDWVTSALCAQVGDPDMWFPGPDEYIRSQQARAICHRCPARTECLTEALRHDHTYGIWGGLTAEQRRTLTRNRTRTPTCPEGHPLTPDNTVVKADGGKRCLTCRRASDRRRKDRAS